MGAVLSSLGRNLYATVLLIWTTLPILFPIISLSFLGLSRIPYMPLVLEQASRSWMSLQNWPEVAAASYCFLTITGFVRLCRNVCYSFPDGEVT